MLRSTKKKQHITNGFVQAPSDEYLSASYQVQLYANPNIGIACTKPQTLAAILPPKCRKTAWYLLVFFPVATNTERQKGN